MTFFFLTDHPLLQDLEIILLSAAVFAVAATALRSPKIVGYIVAGLFLGPLTGILSLTEVVDLIAEVGIALLLFLVGLELSFKKIQDVGKVAVVAGGIQVAVTFCGGLGLAWLFGIRGVESLVLALALTFSSTVVVVKVLHQKRDLDELYGRISVGILLVQDVVVIVALTAVGGLGRAGTVEATQAVGSLLVAFAGMALLLGAALAAARWILPGLFRWISESPEGLFIWSLCWCFLFILGAESLRLSLEVGAFLAGISLAQLPYAHLLQRRVHPLMNFFIAIFFVVLGVQMDLSAAAALWREALAFSAFVMLGKPLLFLVILSRLGHDGRTSFLTGITLSQISEFSFILTALAVATGLAGLDLLSLVGVVGLATISASTYFMVYADRLMDLVGRLRLLRLFGISGNEVEPPTTSPPVRDHIVVVGMNALGDRLVRELVERGEEVLAVDTDAQKLAGLPARTLLGNIDAGSVLEAAGLDRAKLVVSALQIEGTNNLLAYRCRERDVPCSIHGFDQSVIRDLERIGADHLILSKSSGLREITSNLRRSGMIGP